jgi:hypothetical protein
MMMPSSSAKALAENDIEAAEGTPTHFVRAFLVFCFLFLAFCFCWELEPTGVVHFWDVALFGGVLVFWELILFDEFTRAAPVTEAANGPPKESERK